MFTEGVTNIKMSEELAIHDDLCSTLEMFNLTDRCTRAEEGRLTLLKHPADDPEDKKVKAKEVKRQGPAVLAAEPELKHGRDHDEHAMDGRLFCVFHNVHTHNTNNCQEPRALRDKRLSRRQARSDRGGGRGGGRWDNRNPRQVWHDQPRKGGWRDQPRDGPRRDQPREVRPQGNASLPPLPPPSRRNDDNHQDEGAGGYQEPRAIACILGGA